MSGFVSTAGMIPVHWRADVSTMVAELYKALKKAGVEEPTARAAAEAVLGRNEGSDLVTTPVLRAQLEGIRREMAELKADLIKWNVGAMAVLTAIFAAIVRLA